MTILAARAFNTDSQYMVPTSRDVNRLRWPAPLRSTSCESPTESKVATIAAELEIFLRV